MKIRYVLESDLKDLANGLCPDVSASQVKQRFEESQRRSRTMLVAKLDGRAVGTVSMGGRRFLR